MTDRRRRAALATPTGIPTGTASVLLRQRWSPSGSPRSSGPDGPPDREPRGSADDNPFAAPPEGRPEQPWRPRRHGSDPSGPPDGDGNGGRDGGDRDRGGDRGEGSSPDWGGRWSRRQPRRQSGGFGGGDRREEGTGGRNGGAPGGMRWDPTDPVQRRARYALVSGGWGLIFALFGLPWAATPLGALAVYWGISSLRAKPGAGGTDGARAARPEDVAGTDRPAPTGPAAPSQAPRSAAGQGGRPQFAAAMGGLVTGVIALVVVAAQFSVQMVYRDYFVCVEDALTNASREACERHLPEELRPFFGEREE